MREQRPALAQRYSIHLPLDLGDSTARFVGTDTSSGQSVVVAFVCPELERLSERGIGALQRHLAGLIDAIATPSLEAFPTLGETRPIGSVLVAELVRGRTLADLIRVETMNADRAVAWTMRILLGLQALHQRQVPHGALSQHAIIAEPKGRPIAPVVTQLVVPPMRDYASPERLALSGPSISDDLWAVGLLLFKMLTGRMPFQNAGSASNRSEVAPSDGAQLRTLPHGRELEQIIKRTLSVDRSRRPGSVEELLDLFDHWERRAALPLGGAQSPGKVPAKPEGGQKAVWDHLADDVTGAGRRLDATLDAAEKMRQSVLAMASGISQPTAAPPPSHVTSESHSAPSQASLPSSIRPSLPAPRRKMPSIGGEMAAFRERSKPRLRRWLLAVGAISCVAVAAYVVLGKRDDHTTAVATQTSSQAATLVVPAAASAPARPRPTAKQEQTQCIRAYFRPDALIEGIDLNFVCSQDDFLAANRRLHEESMVPLVSTQAAAAIGSAATEAAPARPEASPSANPRDAAPTAPTMVIKSDASTKGWQLGWYELLATAIIQQSCCREAVPIRLPESAGWCQQLQTVVRRIASDSAKVGDISPGVRAFDEAVACLLAQGKHIVYPYRTVPSTLHKQAFQQFLKYAAEVDAKRSGRR